MALQYLFVNTAKNDIFVIIKPIYLQLISHKFKKTKKQKNKKTQKQVSFDTETKQYSYKVLQCDYTFYNNRLLV